MSVSLTSPITGAAQTGFTSPTYTITADTAPSVAGKQWAVTALGGTQTSVRTHSVSDPFTVSVFRPLIFKVLDFVSTITGLKGKVPRNMWKLYTRKGVIPYSNAPAEIFPIETRFPVPAGADANDAANIRAALSAHIGALQQVAAGLGDSLVTGIL